MSYTKKIGCYIHIPFCNKICSYCDFCKIFYKEEIVDKYLEELKSEISSSYNNEIIDTLYIGGGTPSSLNLKQLENILKYLNEKLNLDKNLEYTIECNFDSITEEKIDILKKYGVNRISFGLESIDENNLKILERNINKENIENIINYCHQVGIDNINIDLMYAIPKETLKVLEKDLNYVLSLDITHISTYSLILEEHTKLAINHTDYIDEDLDAKMYELINKKLSNWKHYEISNFAKEEKYKSKHNQKYWNNEEYYGYGLGSSGYEGNVRYNKTKSLVKYFNKDYIKEDGIEFLTLKDKIYYEIILGLRTEEGIDLNKFKEKYQKELKDFYQYDNLIKQKILILENNHLFIPKKLWYISNSIIIKLLEGEV